MTHEQFITLETAKLAKQAGFDWYNDPTISFNFSTPTQAVLQRWLREVKNCEVVVDIGINARTAHTYEPLVAIAHEEETPAVTWMRFDNGRKYTTYEAALEAGLQKCLTMIIEKQ